MSESLSLFLGCSFAKDKVGADGRYSDQGISDWDLAQIVKETVEATSGGRIKVVITKDPYGGYISSKVREEIAASDLMMCLFTRRTPTPNNFLWITSTYVISEGAAFLMQLPTETEMHHRLFALMEEGVDPDQLGMAFPPGSRAVLRFQRMDIAGLKEHVHSIVRQILGHNVAIREPWEYLSLDKTVTIFRDGRVQVETRHRFRFTTPTGKVAIPHTIWRVSRNLPPVSVLIKSERDPKEGILRCLPLDCSHQGQKSCKLRIIPQPCKGDSNEYCFLVEASGIQFQPGEELAYAIAWEYGDAFSANSKQPNSVGLRCGERGIARHASFTIQFERDLDHPDRILEEAPKLSVSMATGFNNSREPAAFWHSPSEWSSPQELAPCLKRSGVRFEVYRWTHDQFHGMAKVTFVPHINYFLPKVQRTDSAIPFADNSIESNLEF